KSYRTAGSGSTTVCSDVRDQRYGSIRCDSVAARSDGQCGWRWRYRHSYRAGTAGIETNIATVIRYDGMLTHRCEEKASRNRTRALRIEIVGKAQKRRSVFGQ